MTPKGPRRDARRLKVLISAYACEPGKGSEPGVGWNFALEMSKLHDLWVLTRANNEPVIREWLETHPHPGLNFVYYDPPGWITRRKRGGRGIHLFYYLWQLLAFLHARGLVKDLDLDLVHHVTFGKYWSPSFFALLPLPFVWGPVGGGESAPMAFYRDFGLYGILYETLRLVARRLFEWDPSVRITARRSTIAIGSTEGTAQRLRKLGCRDVRVQGESALTPDVVDDLASQATGAREGSSSGPITFISVGRLLHFKAFYLGLRAFAASNLDRGEYWVVGDGPDRGRLEREAADLGIAERTRFLGQLPRSETLGAMARSNVLVHPSLHESGGWVCLEAMAVGLPVLCVDRGGPGYQVTEATGFKVEADSPDQVVADLAAAMRRLHADGDLLHRMGWAGRARVRADFLWRSKAEWLDRVYREAVAAGRG